LLDPDLKEVIQREWNTTPIKNSLLAIHILSPQS
jgi:hypothetical protein